MATLLSAIHFAVRSFEYFSASARERLFEPSVEALEPPQPVQSNAITEIVTISLFMMWIRLYGLHPLRQFYAEDAHCATQDG